MAATLLLHWFLPDEGMVGMDIAIQLLLMSDARLLDIVFGIVGVMVYFIDYRKFKTDPVAAREAAFSKGIALTYVIGSIASFILMQVLNIVL